MRFEHVVPAVLTLSMAQAPAVTVPATPPGARQIPLVEGLTIVTAVSNGKADFESIKRISEVAGDFVRVTITSDTPTEDGTIVPVIRSRLLRRHDLEAGRTYSWNFSPSRPEAYPGSTALGVSTAVLRDLHATGEAQLDMNDGVSSSPASGVLRRVDEHAVPFRVVVNDELVQLPAIHARGRLGAAAAEFWILDDEANPLALRWSVGPIRLQAVRLSFPQSSSLARLERELQGTGRIVLYGIYFDSGSDGIKKESGATLGEVADVLRRNPSWTLMVEGHTDWLGGDPGNVNLSRRRAAAVKQALVAAFGIDAGRLQTAGFGASRPKDANDTLEGRARNRRVELVRVQ